MDPLSLANIDRPEIKADPYLFYAKLRSEDPIRWDAPLESWVVSRYDDIVALLRDPRMSSARYRHGGPGWEAAPTVARVARSMMVYQDPPDHTRLRKLVSAAFSPRAIAGLRNRVLEEITTLLDEAERCGELDVIADFAYPLTTVMIGTMLGVPRGAWAQLKRWEDGLSQILGNLSPTAKHLKAAEASLQGYCEYFQALMVERRSNPADDILTGLIHAEQDGDRLTENELFSTCQLLMMTGHATTTYLIGNMVRTLMDHPGLLARLRAHPEDIKKAIPELARYDSSAQLATRIALEPMMVRGGRIQPGAVVRLVLGAANRDPAKYSDPNTLKLDRDLRRSLVFGTGRHLCLGAHLATLQSELAITELIRRFPTLRRSTRRLEWLPTHSLRGVKELRVSVADGFGARASQAAVERMAS